LVELPDQIQTLSIACGEKYSLALTLKG